MDKPVTRGFFIGTIIVCICGFFLYHYAVEQNAKAEAERQALTERRIEVMKRQNEAEVERATRR